MTRPDLETLAEFRSCVQRARTETPIAAVGGMATTRAVPKDAQDGHET